MAEEKIARGRASDGRPMEHNPFEMENQVKRANRRFFDLVSGVYEQADRRRGPELASYLRQQIERLEILTRGSRVLDLGTGSGFAAGIARERFPVVVGVDISPEIARRAAGSHPDCSFVCADSDSLPFANDSFDCVMAVAVLHHVLRFDSLLKEVHRVLKPGGVLYTDHDIEGRFCRLFRLPLGIFRLMRDEEKSYRELCSGISHDMYELSEIHRNGVDVDVLQRDMDDIGFSDVRLYYHWYGLSRLFDHVARVLSPSGRGVRGFAPSFSIWARK